MRRPILISGVILAATIALSGCGDAGSSGTEAAPSGSASGGAKQACAAVAGTDLVVLDDDKKLQTVDNLIPAVNGDKGSPALVAALDKVSAVLTTDDLVGLNKQADVDRKSPASVAKEYANSKGLLTPSSGGSGKVTVGAANFSENQIVANLYASALNAAGFEATVRTVGNREVYLPELQKGNLTVVPEYVGTLTEFLNKKENGANAEAKASSDLDATVKALAALGLKSGLVFGKPAEAADQNAFAVTKAFADKNGVKTLSDLGSKCGALVLGGPPECPQRPFCQPGLEKTYGLQFGSFKALDAGGPLTKSALKSGAIAIGLVFSSDGSLAAG
ncbi:glycine betaine ABC transporter substrate-binding protein [Angustibacter luteus]|uniref:Glycine betaine ABC transporter substrate-binding protein n=1 Tax=Angustibacter luteus TaxID=658456 RepID=A0ABW1JEC1_9ACTN